VRNTMLARKVVVAVEEAAEEEDDGMHTVEGGAGDKARIGEEEVIMVNAFPSSRIPRQRRHPARLA